MKFLSGDVLNVKSGTTTRNMLVLYKFYDGGWRYKCWWPESTYEVKFPDIILPRENDCIWIRAKKKPVGRYDMSGGQGAEFSIPRHNVNIYRNGELVSWVDR